MTWPAGDRVAGLDSEVTAVQAPLGGGGLEAALLAASAAVRAACLREVRQVEAFYERRLAQLEREHEALARGLMEENSRLVHERAALQETVAALRAEAELAAARARPAAAYGAGAPAPPSYAGAPAPAPAPSAYTGAGAPPGSPPPRRQQPLQLHEEQQHEPRPLSLYERERLRERLVRPSPGSRPEGGPSVAAAAVLAPSSALGAMDEQDSSAPHRDLLAEIDRSLLGNPAERQDTGSSNSSSSSRRRSSSSVPRPASPSFMSSPRFASLAYLSNSPMDLSARGRAFFRQARTQLSEHDYERLVAAMKDLNRGAQTRGETAALAKQLLGAGGRQLGADFEDLLEGRSRDHAATTDLF